MDRYGLGDGGRHFTSSYSSLASVRLHHLAAKTRIVKEGEAIQWVENRGDCNIEATTVRRGCGMNVVNETVARGLPGGS